MPLAQLTRRQWLRLMGAGSLGLLGGSVLPFVRRSAGAAENRSGAAFAADLEVQLAATPGQVPLLPGPLTDVWQFAGQVIRGDPGALAHDARSYLGPTFKVRRGQKLRVHLDNHTSQPTIVHWHGLKLNDRSDGHPRFAFDPGGRFTYEFEVRNRPGTYWYHPHPHQLTGPQVYGGLAGLFLVSDAQEDALNLPSGEFDLPLVIQDRRFGMRNGLIYLQHPMDQMNGMLGDRILVNGQVDAEFSCAARTYRLRLLNGSNARIYRLAWEDGRPLTIIGSDGGLLERPAQRPSVMFGPGERLELWADFSADPVGSRPALISLTFDAGGGRMGRGMMGRGMMGRIGGDSMEQGAPFQICSFRLDRTLSTGPALPQQFAPLALPHPAEAVNYERPKSFFLEMSHMQWTINGRLFEMTDAAPDEQVRLGTTELWEFINPGGGGMMGMMQMPHPMHLHGVQFRVLERIGGSNDEFFDEGWQDTTLVWPGQAVRILVPFEHPGLFVYHCHNLEHEDMGMMRNFWVR